MIGMPFTQRLMDSPEPPKVFTDFWTLAYGAMGMTASRRVVAGVTAEGLEPKKDTEPLNVLLPPTGIFPNTPGRFQIEG
jgi:hypothetical protein